MGTFLRIQVEASTEKDSDRWLTMARAEVDRYESLMSLYRADSELSILNREGASRCVPISPTTIRVIENAIAVGHMTDGAFDVTVGSPGFKEGEGFEQILIEKKCIRLGRSGLRIDLGGIAKGAALEAALHVLAKAGARTALVDLGGNIGVIGGSESNKLWWVEAPLPKGMNLDVPTFRLDEGFVSTSSQLEQPGHILNPATGKAAKSDLISVTTIHRDGALGDALSTGFFVMGFEKAKRFLEQHRDVGGCLVKLSTTSEPSAQPEEDRLFCRPFEARNEDGDQWRARSSRPSQ